MGRPGRTTTNEPGIAKQTSTDTLVNRQRSADGLVNRQKSTDVASKESQLPPQGNAMFDVRVVVKRLAFLIILD